MQMMEPKKIQDMQNASFQMQKFLLINLQHMTDGLIKINFN